jgi:hypothetical protein
MILVLYLTLIFATAWGQSSSPVIDPDKFTICAITINSDDEKKIFQAQAKKNPNKFNPVVELTDLGDDWFSKSCSSGLRCDQLVISGHFGGSFFGDSGKSLSLQELEKAGCSKSCEGILSQPYEVFLFGCNTLSSKDSDHRTPAQYLQVLLSDGIPLAQAEMVVESRYGAVGDSHKASMQRAFSGDSKQLYGFHSVGPSGKNVKGFLENYFTKVSAADQLEKLQAKRMMNQVNMANKALAESLKSTAFAQCAAADLKDEASKKACELYDDRKTTGQKLDLTLELLSQENFLIYLPAINAFMKNVNYESLSIEDKQTLDMIKNNEVIKKQVLALVDRTQSLGLKGEWLDLSHNLGFIDQAEVSKRITSAVEKMFAKPITENDSDLLCALDGRMKDKIKLSNQNIKNTKFSQNEIWAFSCLSPIEDQILVSRIISTKFSPSNIYLLDELVRIARYSLLHGSPLPPDLLTHAKKQLSNADTYAAGNALEFLAIHRPEDKNVLATAIKFINDPKDDNDKKSYGINAIEIMKTNDVKVLGEVLNLTKNKKLEYVDQQIVNILLNAKSDDKAIQRGISELLSHDKVSGYDKMRVIIYLKDLKPEDPAIHQELIKAARADSYNARHIVSFLKELNLSPENREELEKLK